MLFFTTSSMIVLFCLSGCSMGLALPMNHGLNDGKLSLRHLTMKYIEEITAQQQAIEAIETQLKISEKPSPQEITKQANVLMELHYRQMPRERWVDMIPTDSVLNTESIEYLVSLSSRYSENVIHAAREIRSNPLQKGSSSLRYLKAEHEKNQIFDRVLLGLTTLAASQKPTENSQDSLPTSAEKSQTIWTESTNAFTVEEELSVQKDGDAGGDDITPTQEALEDDEEVETTTTETVTTSYSETTITWSD